MGCALRKRRENQHSTSVPSLGSRSYMYGFTVSHENLPIDRLNAGTTGANVAFENPPEESQCIQAAPETLQIYQSESANVPFENPAEENRCSKTAQESLHIDQSGAVSDENIQIDRLKSGTTDANVPFEDPAEENRCSKTVPETLQMHQSEAVSEEDLQIDRLNSGTRDDSVSYDHDLVDRVSYVSSLSNTSYVSSVSYKSLPIDRGWNSETTDANVAFENPPEDSQCIQTVPETRQINQSSKVENNTPEHAEREQEVFPTEQIDNILAQACYKGWHSVVEGLLSSPSRRFSIAEKNKALLLASEQGHGKVVQVLLRDSSFDVNSINRLGYNALHLSCIHANLPVLGILLKNKRVDINIPNSNGNNALHLAAKLGRHQVTHDLLEDDRLDVNLLNSTGNNALHLACIMGYPLVVKQLLKNNNCDINLPNTENGTGQGYSPLHLARRAGHLKITKLILSDPRCEQINIHIKDGNSQLHLASPPAVSHEKFPIDRLKSVTTSNSSRGSGGFHENLAIDRLDFGATDANVSFENPPKQTLGSQSTYETLQIDLSEADSDENLPIDRLHSVTRDEFVSFETDTNDNTSLYVPTPIYTNLPIAPVISGLNHTSDCTELGNITNNSSTFSTADEELVEASGKGDHVAVNNLLNSPDRHCTTSEKNKALILASEQGHSKVVDVLLRDPSINVNSVNFMGDNPLHLSCLHGQDLVLDVLLRNRDVDINIPNSNGNNAFHMSAQFGHSHVAQRLLIDGRLNVNLLNSTGNSALHLACIIGCPSVVNELLKAHNCDVNLPNTEEITGHKNSPLHLVCKAGHIDVAKLLLNDSRCDQINVQNEEKNSPLHLSCISGHLEVTKLLLKDSRCDQINVQNKEENSPLHLSCISGHLEVTKLLLKDSRCDQINVQNKDGNSPFDLCIINKNLEIAEFLLSNTRQSKKSALRLNNAALNLINIPNSDGNSQFHIACQNGHLEVIKLLLSDSRCDQINVPNKVGNSPLHIACWAGHLDVIKLLLSNSRCDHINVQNKDGNSPLHIACIEEHLEVTELLLSDSICDQMNGQNKDGNSPLHLSCIARNIEIIKILLSDKRSDQAIVKNKDGNSPVDLCVINKNLDIAESILTYTKQPKNASIFLNDASVHLINAPDSDGNSQFHFAYQNGYIEIIKLLLSDPRFEHINAQDQHGNTVFHYVCKHGWFDLTDKLLLDSKCNKSIKNNRGETFLNSLVERLTTCEEKEIQEVVDRLETSMKQGIVTQGTSSSALVLYLRKVNDAQEFTTSSRAEKRLAELQRYHQVKSQARIVTYAVNRNSLGLCKYVFENGAKVNEPLPSGETALHCAVRLNSIVKVELIMKHNPDLAAKWRGLTPFQFAISISSSQQILQMLAHKNWADIKRDLEKCCAVGETPLTCSIRLGVSSWIKHFKNTRNVIKKDGTGLSGNELMYKFQLNEKLSKRSSMNMRKWKKYKSAAGVKLSPGKICKVNNDIALKTLISCRANFTQQKEEVSSVISLTKRVLENASEEISSKPDAAHLAFTAELAGSMAEGTKCYFPDELDWLCVFKQTRNLEFQHTFADFFHIKVKPDSPWINQSTDGLLEQGKVSASLYGEIETALAKLIANGVKFGPLHLFNYSFLLRDKISGLQLLFRGKGFKDMVVYVDLVPVFRLPECTPFKPEEPLPLGVDCSVFYLISKKSRHEDDITDYEFRVTTSVGERAVIIALPDDVRDGFIFAKAVRLASICGRTRWFERVSWYLGRYHAEKYVSEPVRTEDYLTSFILKNVLFAILLAPNQDDKPQSPYEWALEIYTTLQCYLEQGAIPAWNYRTSGYLLDCRECPEDDEEISCENYEACCKKRGLMEAFTNNIISWLEENKSELEQVTFS